MDLSEPRFSYSVYVLIVLSRQLALLMYSSELSNTSVLSNPTSLSFVYHYTKEHDSTSITSFVPVLSWKASLANRGIFMWVAPAVNNPLEVVFLVQLLNQTKPNAVRYKVSTCFADLKTWVRYRATHQNTHDIEHTPPLILNIIWTVAGSTSSNVNVLIPSNL